MRSDHESDAHARPVAERFMLAGDERDVPFIRALLATLPERSYGQVYLERSRITRPEPLPAPGRVSVQWVEADPDAPGAALARAIGVWREEFLCAPEYGDPSEFDVWIGCATCPVVAGLHRVISQEIQHQV